MIKSEPEACNLSTSTDLKTHTWEACCQQPFTVRVRALWGCWQEFPRLIALAPQDQKPWQAQILIFLPYLPTALLLLQMAHILHLLGMKINCPSLANIQTRTLNWASHAHGIHESTILYSNTPYWVKIKEECKQMSLKAEDLCTIYTCLQINDHLQPNVSSHSWKKKNICILGFSCISRSDGKAQTWCQSAFDRHKLIKIFR